MTDDESTSSCTAMRGTSRSMALVTLGNDDEETMCSSCTAMRGTAADDVGQQAHDPSTATPQYIFAPQ